MRSTFINIICFTLLTFNGTAQAMDTSQFAPMPDPQKTPDSKALAKAIRSGDAIMAQKLINQNANVNAPLDEKGWTPLLEGIFQDSPSCIRLLIKEKADVNIQAALGPPLYFAAAWGDREATLLLLDAGADIYQKTKFDNCSALRVAALAHHLGVCELLVEKMLDIQDIYALISCLRTKNYYGQCHNIKNIFEPILSALARARREKALANINEINEIAIKEHLLLRYFPNQQSPE